MSSTLRWSTGARKLAWMWAGMLFHARRHGGLQPGMQLTNSYSVHRSKANGYSQDELRLMKQRDVNFMQQRLQAEERVCTCAVCAAYLCITLARDVDSLRLITRVHLQGTERLRERLHFLGCAAPSNHVVFVDNERLVRQLSPAQHFGTPAELLDRFYNRPTIQQLSARAETSARYEM